MSKQHQFCVHSLHSLCVQSNDHCAMCRKSVQVAQKLLGTEEYLRPVPHVCPWAR